MAQTGPKSSYLLQVPSRAFNVALVLPFNRGIPMLDHGGMNAIDWGQQNQRIGREIQSYHLQLQ
jgi:hypothetical protein